MIFTETKLAGAYVVDIEPRGDDRGMFARVFCKDEFAEHGLTTEIAQSNLSVTADVGTIRGLHRQVDGAEEDKLIRCVRGRILDVFVDVRPDSPTFLQHEKVELDAESKRMAYVPKGFAHGFLTLTGDCEVFYHVSHPYAPDRERGIRWNDPLLGIDWGIEDPILSPKDAGYPDWTP